MLLTIYDGYVCYCVQLTINNDGAHSRAVPL